MPTGPSIVMQTHINAANRWPRAGQRSDSGPATALYKSCICRMYMPLLGRLENRDLNDPHKLRRS